MGKIIEFLRDEKAATSIEYAMIASCVAVAIIGSVRGLGTKLNTVYTGVSTALK